ncbi:MAG: amidohydrolase, partial [Chloroflexi bacterium]|nr:amidohydrolase [Chloroflexota bacterium]
KAAVRELERAVKDLGLIGAKFMAAAQRFFPDDPRFYPLWEKAQELGAVLLFHVGTTGLGAGAPGGSGVKLKYTRPIHIDDVAADFPELKIIMAHPAWPWMDEGLAVAVHKANVYVDLSGWSPRYFPPELVREVNSRLQDKALFGSDYPYIMPDRWLRDFESLDLKPEVKQKVLVDNAKKLLKL